MTKEKTLSEQICELCGIELRCINCGQTVSNENPCKMPCDKQKLPDFENPENFVKLLELRTKTSGTILDIISTDYNISTCKSVIISLSLRIANENHGDVDEIKQAIREYDGWVWG